MESSVGGGVRSRGGWSPQQRWRPHQTAERRPLHLATICFHRFYRSAASSPLIGRQLGSYLPPARLLLAASYCSLPRASNTVGQQEAPSGSG